MKPGARVRVIDAANLPCVAGDTGTVHAIRQEAREFPIGVIIDGVQWCDWFKENELQLIEEQA
jgi:hypothetical protein